MAQRRSSRADSPRSTRETAKPQKASVLERLAPDEARTVLHRLLVGHADLRAEAEQIALGLLGEVTFQSVADDVECALRALDLDDLGSRAGQHHAGYTSPTEAAWELLQEVVDPFLSDMKRQIDLGLAVQALEICKGVLLGLYRIRHMKGDEFLRWRGLPDRSRRWRRVNLDWAARPGRSQGHEPAKVPGLPKGVRRRPRA